MANFVIFINSLFRISAECALLGCLVLSVLEPIYAIFGRKVSPNLMDCLFLIIQFPTPKYFSKSLKPQN